MHFVHTPIHDIGVIEFPSYGMYMILSLSTCTGINKAPTHLPGNQDGALWVAEVPDDYWRAVPMRLFKLLTGVAGEIRHDSFSITIRLVFH